jgi:Zn-dependent oligopeptidase
MKKENFNFDEEKLKEYFPSENVKVATMDIY